MHYNAVQCIVKFTKTKFALYLSRNVSRNTQSGSAGWSKYPTFTIFCLFEGSPNEFSCYLNLVNLLLLCYPHPQILKYQWKYVHTMGLPSLYMDFLLDFILSFLGVKEQKGGVGLMKCNTIGIYLPSVSFWHSFGPETAVPFIFPLWDEKRAQAFL